MHNLRADILELFAEAQLFGRDRRLPVVRSKNDERVSVNEDGYRVVFLPSRKAIRLRSWEENNHVRRRAYKTRKQREYALAGRVRQLLAGVKPKKWGRKWRDAMEIVRAMKR